MNPLLVWFLAYVVPAATAGGIAFLFPRKTSVPRRDILIIHGALLVSIVATQYTIHSSGLAFPWHLSLFSFFALVLSAGIAVALVGRFGFLYAISAFIQELTMLSVAFLLLPTFPVYIVILLVGGVFVPCHFLTLERWKLKLLLVSLWSVASVLLFVLTSNVYLVAAIHTILGSLLISRSILFAGMRSDSPPTQDLVNEDLYQVFLMRCPATLPFSFAAHTYLVVNRKGTITRYGVSRRASRGDNLPVFGAGNGHVCESCKGHLHVDGLPPFEGIEILPGVSRYAWRSRIAGCVEGGEGSLAERMAGFIAQTFDDYPYAERYSLLGPNSNTYPAWVLAHFPDSGLRQPWNAIGKNFLAQLSV